jgi:hypothetical protein
MITKAEEKFSNDNVQAPVHLSLAKQQISKLQESAAKFGQSKSAALSPDDIEFADAFLEYFTLNAFPQEMAMLQEQEGDKMTEEDLATLAESIRSFGLGISKSERHLFR